MKFAGKAEEVAIKLIDTFRNGKLPQAMAMVFVRGQRHCQKWSWTNQLLVALEGEKDARTFNQWKEIGFYPQAGTAFYIWAPLQSRREVTKNDGTKEKRCFTYGFRGMPVFGASKVKGPNGEAFEFTGEQFIKTLPLIQVAEEWRIKVGAYNGSANSGNGYYSSMFNQIELGVENPSTFAHELVHAADDRMGALDIQKYGKDKKERASAEIVAELGGAVVLCAIGLEHQADLGGCWEYVQHWAKHTGKDTAEVCLELVNRIGAAVNHILETYDEIVGNTPAEIEQEELATV